MNRSNTPLINALNNFIAEEKTIMHMPGHKQGKGFDADFINKIVRFDLTELPGLDNFHKPEGAILESMDALKKAVGSLKSYFLVNGSSSGIHAGILSCFKRGDKILVNRNCHKSVINALILIGIKPVFIMPDYLEEFNLPLPPDFSSWKKALDENPEVKGAFVTTPDYYGICQPLADLADLLHEHGKLLLVDEAHGAHFAFSDELPETALKQGADLCVQSFHKTLPAFTQAAVLHIGSTRINAEKVQRAISMLTTTSPSYMIMASMDYARDFLERKGEEAYGKLAGMLDDIKQRLKKMKNLRLIPDNIGGIERDPTRLVIDTSLSDITGYALYNRLCREYGIYAEMSDISHVVFILTLADTWEDIYNLAKALTEIDKSLNKGGNKFSFRMPLSAGECSLADLNDFLDSSEEIPLEDAEGCVSAEMVTPYPPGIPVLCPGELITKEHIQYLAEVIRSGADVHGMGTDKNGTKTVRIIQH